MNLLEAYRYLVALDEHRHFGRAASACHITQPALSNALRALEDVLGCSLVVRGRSFERFTPEGEVVLLTAHRMMREQENLRQQLKGHIARPQGALVIAAVPTALPIAVRFAAHLIDRHPGIHPQVRSLPSQAIETGLDSLSIDLGLGYTHRQGTSHAERFGIIAQWIEHYYLVCAQTSNADHAATPVTWEAASGMRLALLAREMHNRLIVDAAFEQARVSVTPVLETNSVLALQVAVTQGGLAAILPGAMLGTVKRWPGLQIRPLIEPDIGTPIGFMVNKQSPPGVVLNAALELAADPAWLAVIEQALSAE
jgi:DNA-binding transcriptional LysR family regulator